MLLKKILIIVSVFIYFAFANSVSAFTSLDQGLIGHWTFDEGEGSKALDYSGNNNHGSINGATRIIDGKLGQALQFDGQDDYVDVPYSNSLNLTNNFTVSLWFNLENKNANWLVSKGVYCARPRAWAFTVNSPSTYHLFYSKYGAIDSVILKRTSPPIDGWQQAVMVYENGQAKLFQNGKSMATVSLNQDFFANKSGLIFGHNSCLIKKPGATGDNYFTFKGLMDEVRIYNRALDEQEVLDLYITDQYNSGVPVIDTTPPSSPINFVNDNSLLQYPNRIDLKWDSATDDISVKGYLIYRDGVQIADVQQISTSTQRYSDVIGLRPSTSYIYTALAYDVKGNRSESSTPVVVKTSAIQRLPAFPGAEGFAAFTPAGSGRNSKPPRTTVYKVTNLNARGRGSLNQCIQGTGARICVFEISGTISLTDDLWINNPFITIAGQTAPSPGITIKGGALRIFTHDVLIQHLHVRVGDDLVGPNPQNRDSIGIEGSVDGSREVYNIIIDHCSVSWAIDENIALWYSGVHDITISNTIISEALHQSMHPKGSHSMGVLIGKEVNNVSLSGNLFAHNHGRNPLIQGLTNTIISNNVVYNPGWLGINISDYHGVGVMNSTLVSNVVIPGINSAGADEAIYVDSNVNSNSRIFSLKNECIRRSEDNSSCVENHSDDGVKSPTATVWVSPLTIIPETKVVASVLKNAGARPADRDIVDQRIVNDVRSSSGKIINCVGAENIPYAKGTVMDGTRNTITLGNNASNYNNGYVGRKIRITGGAGSGQIRNIIRYLGASTRTATIDRGWTTIPSKTSTYEIILDCSLNAGGWPLISENVRALTIPDNPNADDNQDGYTNLENWLYQYAQLVTDPSQLPDLDHNGIPDLIEAN